MSLTASVTQAIGDKSNPRIAGARNREHVPGFLANLGPSPTGDQGYAGSPRGPHVRFGDTCAPSGALQISRSGITAAHRSHPRDTSEESEIVPLYDISDRG